MSTLTTRELLAELGERMLNTQNSTRGRDLGVLCREALDGLDRSILERRGRGASQHVVTVRVAKNREHDKYNKIRGVCPVFSGTCSDITGEHHSVLVASDKPSDAIAKVEKLSGVGDMPVFTITRVEEV